MKTLKTILDLEVLYDFNFWCTVGSSGWCALTPFSFDKQKPMLIRIQRLTSGEVVKATVTQQRRGGLVVEVEHFQKLDEADIREMENVVKTCLRLDEDFSPLYKMLRKYPDFCWVEEIGAGRLLRSPTVFEDVVKTICSTNCSWALTKSIVDRLCKKLGENFSAGYHTFPAPRRVASVTEDFMRKEIKAGYRSPYLLELAQKIVDNELDVEKWRDSSLDSTTLKKEIMKVKGVGDYASDHILKLLGRYEFLALDSWLRRRYAQIRKEGKPVKDKEIEEWYASFGKWMGLVFWLDMTKDFLISHVLEYHKEVICQKYF